MILKKIFKNIFLLNMLVISLLFVNGCAWFSAEPTPTGPKTLEEALILDIDPIWLDYESTGGQVGICLSDMEGNLIYGHKQDQLFVPASIQKLAVAADAFVSLPRDFRYDTRIFTTGPLDSNGVVDGDLVIVGNWDPSLSGDYPYNDWPWVHFRAWSEIMVEQGVRRINGNIIAVGDLFTPGGWETGDLWARYAPVISELTWSDGLLTTRVFSISGGTPGVQDLFREVMPSRKYWTRDYTLLRINSGNGESAPNASQFYDTFLPPILNITADQPLPGRDWLPVLDPRALTADALRQSLSKAGIEGCDSTIVTTIEPERPHDYRTIGLVHRSAVIDSIIRPMLAVSSNTWAEMISATVQEYKGNSRVSHPTWYESLDSIGVDITGIRCDDACGMSRKNLLYPSTVNDLLVKAQNTWGNRWTNLLTHPKEPKSSFENRLGDLSERLLVKSGTMSRIYSLAGYILVEDRPEYAFTIIFNNIPDPGSQQRQAIDSMIRMIVDDVDRFN